MNLRVEVPRALAALAAYAWPGPCACCGADLPGRAVAGVCPACWVALPLRIGPGCPVCDLPGATLATCPDCRTAGGSAPLETIVTALLYTGAAVTLHRRMKFGGASDLVPPLARRMASAWRLRGPFEPDLVVPVPPDPLRWTARRRAGRLLARGVTRQLGVPLVRALAKTRPTRSQTGRAAEQRRRALDGAFRARREAVEGRAVLVVDDVVTTGATLREAARALAAVGAAPIAGLALARTPTGSTT
ncbi:MAG: ComF family protein [Acidobacteria bacterium]|nr:ComF family protein [Acidobacteriota bacterium]